VTGGAAVPAGVNTSGGTCSGGDGKALTHRSNSSGTPTPVAAQTGTTGWKDARAIAFSRSATSTCSSI